MTRFLALALVLTVLVVCLSANCEATAEQLASTPKQDQRDSKKADQEYRDEAASLLKRHIKRLEQHKTQLMKKESEWKQQQRDKKRKAREIAEAKMEAKLAKDSKILQKRAQDMEGSKNASKIVFEETLRKLEFAKCTMELFIKAEWMEGSNSSLSKNSSRNSTSKPKNQKKKVKKPTRMCFPKACAALRPGFMHIPKSWTPMTEAVDECGKGEHPCRSANIKLPIPKSMMTRIPKCGHYKHCSRRKNRMMCQPLDLKGTRIPSFSKYVQHCPKCVRPCMPACVRKAALAAGLPNKKDFKFTIPKCRQRTNCRKVERGLCLPHELRMVKGFRKLRLSRIIPYCKHCQSMCKSEYFSLPKHVLPGACKQQYFKPCPRDGRPGDCFSKGRKKCLPHALRFLSLRGVTGLDIRKKIPPCKRCDKPCLPAEILSAIPQQLRRMLHVPACKQKKCKSVEYRFCLPRYSKVRIPGLNRGAIPSCGRCEKTCLPPYLRDVNQRGLNKFPMCKHEPKCKKVAPSVCLPRFMRGVKIPNLPHIPVCPRCVGMCLPFRLQTRNKHILPRWMSVPSCQEDKCAARPRTRACIPHSLVHYAKKTRVLRYLRLPICKRECAFCLPKYIKLPPLAMNLDSIVESCQERRSVKTAFCHPRELVGVRIFPQKLYDKIGRCPSGVEPCVPRGLNKYVKRSWVRFPTCTKPKCNGEKVFKFCLPPHLRFMKQRVKAFRDVDLKECQACEEMCIPRYFKKGISIVDGVAIAPPCPKVKCPKGEMREAVCLPPEMKAARFPGSELLRPCPPCVKPCLTAKVRLEIGLEKQVLKLPTCGDERSTCESQKFAFCLPRHLQHVNLGKDMSSLMKTCPRCTMPCIPREIKGSSVKLPVWIKFRRCPRSAPVKCSNGHKRVPCLPKAFMLTTNSSDLLRPLNRTCRPCEKPCYPKWFPNSVQLPFGIRMNFCPGVQAPEVKTPQPQDGAHKAPTASQSIANQPPGPPVIVSETTTGRPGVVLYNGYKLTRATSVHEEEPPAVQFYP